MDNRGGFPYEQSVKVGLAFYKGSLGCTELTGPFRGVLLVISLANFVLNQIIHASYLPYYSLSPLLSSTVTT